MTTSEQITPPSPASNPNFALGVPSPNQIEVSLFGPGYGESIVFHLPGGYWVVVDSCVRPNSKRSAPLEYLELLGVDMATRVALIVASHWHDDHVRGLAELVSQCRSASFACANALCQNEFLTLVARHQQQRTIEMGSGVSEMAATFDMLRGRQPMVVGPDRMILNVDGSSIAPNLRSTVTTLSPSDKQFQIFISEIASLIPATRATKYRAVALRPNHVAMALWVNVGEDCSILLGSDLEDVGTDVNLGWNAILRSTTRPQGRASVFKVAHHGSRTGHNDSVWSSMLQGNPISILTPFVRGRVALPTPGDATRIMNFSSHAHSTARVRQPAGRQRSHDVEKTIREAVGRSLRPIEQRFGHIRLRKVVG